jgi:Cullin family/Cullin protein neddylation domain
MEDVAPEWPAGFEGLTKAPVAADAVPAMLQLLRKTAESVHEANRKGAAPPAVGAVSIARAMDRLLLCAFRQRLRGEASTGGSLAAPTFAVVHALVNAALEGPSGPENARQLARFFARSTLEVVRRDVLSAVPRNAGADVRARLLRLERACDAWDRAQLLARWMRRLFFALEREKSVGLDGGGLRYCVLWRFVREVQRERLDVVFVEDAAQLSAWERGEDPYCAQQGEKRAAEVRRVLGRSRELFAALECFGSALPASAGVVEVDEAVAKALSQRSVGYIGGVESALLQRALEHYEREGPGWLRLMTVPAYAKLVRRALDAESARAQRYFRAASEEVLVAKLASCLVDAQLEALLAQAESGFSASLADEAWEAVETIARVALPTAAGPRLLAAALGDWVERRWAADAQVGRGAGDELLTCRKVHVVRLAWFVLDHCVRSNAAAISATNDALRKCIRDDPDAEIFARDVARILDRCVRRDSATSAEAGGGGDAALALASASASASSTRTPSSASALPAPPEPASSLSALGLSLREVAQLFDLVASKDTVLEEARVLMTRRLLDGVVAPAVMETERDALLHLKSVTPAVAQLERMWGEAQACKELVSDTERGAVVGRCRVLCAGTWPAPSSVYDTVPLPRPVLSTLAAQAESQFRAAFSGRKFRVALTHGTVSLRRNGNIVGTGSGTTPTPTTAANFHVIDCSTLQAILLLQFNDAPSISLHDLALRLQIDPRAVLPVLVPLLRPAAHEPASCLLRLAKPPAARADASRVETSKAEASKVRPEDVVVVNDAFACAKRRLQMRHGALLAAAGRGGAGGGGGGEGAVAVERRHQLEAAIVRILKARKSASMHDVVEAVAHASLLFKPDVRLVKAVVDGLIDADYLRRGAEDANLLVYNP